MKNLTREEVRDYLLSQIRQLEGESILGAFEPPSIDGKSNVEITELVLNFGHKAGFLEGRLDALTNFIKTFNLEEEH